MLAETPVLVAGERPSWRVMFSPLGNPQFRWLYLSNLCFFLGMGMQQTVRVWIAFELTGSENVFADRAERYPEISLEELTRAQPDVVFLATEPFPFNERHASELSEATGIDARRIRIVDGEFLSWHGSRTPDGVDYVATVMGEAREALRNTG